MKCNQFVEYIASGVSFSAMSGHIEKCKTCSGRLKQIDQCMSLLDEKVQVPEDLAAKILRRVRDVKFPAPPATDYSKYLQLAAVVAAGIFLGVVLGRNADGDFFLSKKGKKTGN
ncbi:MAG: hypothetical protein RBS73_09010 [Prolixibacteraceae bacterium]|nr:hypothetical protein [Prolixibacteraceae bacterium]